METAGRSKTVLACAAIAIAVAILTVLTQNAVIAMFVPHLERPTQDFSPAYLSDEIRSLQAGPPQAIFLGDSVLWGYNLEPNETAVSMLAAQGCPCRNLSFKAGSPANYYLLSRLMVASGIRPKVVVLEVNQAVLNWGDPYYQSLHPGIAALGSPMLAAADRAKLTIPDAPAGFANVVDRSLSSVSLLYAMRSDIRETLFGEPPPPDRKRVTPDLFAGTYDLSALDDDNVGVHFFEMTADLWRQHHVPLVAVLTPTNHTLLHQYIDNKLYRKNGEYLKALFERRGARVVDLDEGFPSDAFFDNAHLTQSGQRRLAASLESALPQYFGANASLAR